MFQIPVETMMYWERRNIRPATSAEILAINALAQGRFAQDFLNFLALYGFALWDFKTANTSDYRIDENGQSALTPFAMRFLHDAASLARCIPNVWRNERENGFPMIPANMIPFAGTANQDMILMEMEPENGRIWYWPFSNDAWGTPGNRTLGFVANSFTDFINNLRIGQDV